jgi:hypothetical protein
LFILPPKRLSECNPLLGQSLARRVPINTPRQDRGVLIGLHVTLNATPIPAFPLKGKEKALPAASRRESQVEYFTCFLSSFTNRDHPGTSKEREASVPSGRAQWRQSLHPLSSGVKC